MACRRLLWPHHDSCGPGWFMFVYDTAILKMFIIDSFLSGQAENKILIFDQILNELLNDLVPGDS